MPNIYNIIFFITVLFNYSLQYLVLKFRTNIDLNELKDENYMSTTLNQKLYVDFNMGDSHQIIPMTLKTQQYPTFIVSSSVSDNITVKYNETKSSKSFHFITDFLIKELYIYDFNEGYLVNDSVTFNSSLVYDNFTYMLATKTNIIANNISGEIGFSKKKEGYTYYYPEKTDFLQQLKDNKLINNKVFGIVYDNEYEGRLFLGTYLHKIDNLYSEEDLITNNINDYTPDKNRDKWMIDFNVKCLGQPDNTEIYIEENTYGLVMYELGLNVGSRTFRENFVIDYFKKKNCNESMVSSKPFAFYQYSCDNEEQFSDFPDIILTLPGKYSFNFTKKELFKKLGNVYVFQIVFEIIELDINYWRLGQVFFRKYSSFFIQGEKKSWLSYYPTKKVAQNEETSQVITGQIILIIILSSILIILFGLLIYFYLYCEKKKRKKVAQELIDDDNYDYTPKENEQEIKKDLNLND